MRTRPRLWHWHARSSPVGGVILAALVSLGATGCGERALPAGGDDDGGAAETDASAIRSLSLEEFCSGPARLEVNGVAAVASVSGRALWANYLNEGAELTFSSAATTPGRIVVGWHAPGSASPAAPAAFPLTAIPAGWTVTVFAGCSPADPGCMAPADVITGGLEGALTIGGQLLDYTMTLCLAHEEPATSPGAVLRSVRLWASGVPAAYDWP